MKNKEVIFIYENSTSLKTLGGFKFSKAVILNIKKIEEEVISVIRERTKNQDNSEEIIKEALEEECACNFIKIKESDIPENITVEQLSLIFEWIE